MKFKFITTNDGSSSLFVPELNENYHSIHGALNESLHVFIKKGLHSFPNNRRLKLLEVGFGTGLNALLTAIESKDREAGIEYYSVEKYPLLAEDALQLNYGQLLEDTMLFEQLHQCSWEQKIRIEKNFELHKAELDLVKDLIPSGFDLVYFDAFAPNKQESMWSPEVFQKIFEAMNKESLLVTYCAQGAVRRKLIATGFEVERTDGPPGKREMLMAWKK